MTRFTPANRIPSERKMYVYYHFKSISNNTQPFALSDKKCRTCLIRLKYNLKSHITKNANIMVNG